MAEPFQSLEARVGQLLTARGQTIVAAESCTGGLILHRLTNIAGSSAYVLGGFVTYSNEAKSKFAGVRAETLQTYGAVSRQTAGEMARGVRAAFSASYALSVTGIAGPGGATDTKPVGLVYIGLSGSEIEAVKEYRWTGDREGNKQLSAEAALQLLYDHLVAVGRTAMSPGIGLQEVS